MKFHFIIFMLFLSLIIPSTNLYGSDNYTPSYANQKDPNEPDYIPIYDFKTHSRKEEQEFVAPKPIIVTRPPND